MNAPSPTRMEIVPRFEVPSWPGNAVWVGGVSWVMREKCRVVSSMPSCCPESGIRPAVIEASKWRKRVAKTRNAQHVGKGSIGGALRSIVLGRQGWTGSESWNGSNLAVRCQVFPGSQNYSHPLPGANSSIYYWEDFRDCVFCRFWQANLRCILPLWQTPYPENWCGTPRGVPSVPFQGLGVAYDVPTQTGNWMALRRILWG